MGKTIHFAVRSLAQVFGEFSTSHSWRFRSVLPRICQRAAHIGTLHREHHGFAGLDPGPPGPDLLYAPGSEGTGAGVNAPVPLHFKRQHPWFGTSSKHMKCRFRAVENSGFGRLKPAFIRTKAQVLPLRNCPQALLSSADVPQKPRKQSLEAAPMRTRPNPKNVVSTHE